jgi:cobalt-zinc-cadmium efflux system membrane fusion protein
MKDTAAHRAAARAPGGRGARTEDPSLRAVCQGVQARNGGRTALLAALVMMAGWHLGATAQEGAQSASAGKSAPAAAEGAAPAGFKPSKEQLASLKIVTIARASFRSEHITDGKIAINGDRSTPVFSPYSGRVTQVLANLGDVVKPGQRLLALQASEFVQGQNDLLAAQASLAAARAALSMAQTTERRKHGLYEAKAASLQDWEQSQSDLAAAQGTEHTAEAALAAVRNRLAILGKTDAEIDALARAEHMDPVAYVVAPIGGTLTDKQVGPGQYLQAGAPPPPYTVGDLSSVWLVANVRETDAPLVKRGQSVEVHVVALPGQVFHATITYVGSSLDPATRRLTVRAEIANPQGLLKPEMFASFSILSGGAASAPAVPETGVIYEGPEARVWILGDDGALALRRIQPGRSANGLLEVLDGVRPGEKVVASGALFIDRAAQGD